MQLELSLVDTGQIGAGQFCEALARQQRERTPLGQIAIEEGILSSRDVRDILTIQREGAGRFGDVAIRLGLMDRHQLAELLHAQVERQRPLLEHLVELGTLTRQQATDSRSKSRGGRVPLMGSRVRETAAMA